MATLLEGQNADDPEKDPQLAEDAVRLYNQGWGIKSVADKFDTSYGAMRRLLIQHGVSLRGRGAGF